MPNMPFAPYVPGYKLTTFYGVMPKVPENKLPAGCAILSDNCDLAYGDLRNTKDGLWLTSVVNAPFGMWTGDGATFFSWTTDVDAVRSPMVKDTFTRLYYTGMNGFWVTNRLGATSAGGLPTLSYKVGVPQPTVPPVLTVMPPTPINATTISTATFEFFYEYQGLKYQIEPIQVSLATDFQSLEVVPPALLSSTPTGASPVLHVTAYWKKTGAMAFDLYTQNSSFPGSGGIYHLVGEKDASGPGYTVRLSVSMDTANLETRAYVYTYVNSYGEEGPPSEPVMVTCDPQLDVKVTVTKDANTGYAPFQEARIYRTPTGSAIASYFYVGSLYDAGGTPDFIDDEKGAQLNEELVSIDYWPPDQGLRNLAILPNGILVAGMGNEIHFSRSYLAHAWPPQFALTTPYDLVGGIVVGSGAVVLTTGHPYFLSGVSPDSMTLTKINIDQAGASKWAVAVVDGRVIFASHDGLVVIDGVTGSLVESQRFFTREVWRDMYRDALATGSMHFSVWDGRLVVWSHEANMIPFMLRFDEGPAGGSMTNLPTFAAQSAFISPITDTFYFATGRDIYAFNQGADLPAQWTSGEMVFLFPVNFGAGLAIVEGSWTVDFYQFLNEAGAKFTAYTKTYTLQLTTGLTRFRLPSGFEAERHALNITGTGKFKELHIGRTFTDLARL